VPDSITRYPALEPSTSPSIRSTTGWSSRIKIVVTGGVPCLHFLFSGKRRELSFTSYITVALSIL
jgi:hypothetical protein